MARAVRGVDHLSNRSKTFATIPMHSSNSGGDDDNDDIDIDIGVECFLYTRARAKPFFRRSIVGRLWGYRHHTIPGLCRG